MKIPRSIQDRIARAIQSIYDYTSQCSVISQYESGDFARSEKVKDLNVRFQWDMFYEIKYVNKELYYELANNYNSNHIQTAMRKLLPTLTKNY